MKKLWKWLTPFAPDQSGAVSVLYELGGIIVICDAGGCAGNICGFDEPRWFLKKSAIFSAGLRDMDAILGRDDRLVAKLCDAAGKMDAAFAAIIGTPVPAVIATDYRALTNLAGRKSGLNILGIETNGMEYYDAGAEKAYLALLKRFCDANGAEHEDACSAAGEKKKGKIGVWGMTPLDFSDLAAGEKMVSALKEAGWEEVNCYGMGAGLKELAAAGENEKNLVVAPSGLKAAKLLKERFGTPYEIYDPLAEALLPEGEESFAGKKILVLHQAVRADSIRKSLLARGAGKVDCASFFLMPPEKRQAGDILLKSEDDLLEAVKTGDYDIIIADRVLKDLLWDYGGEWIDMKHFALSGRLENDES